MNEEVIVVDQIPESQARSALSEDGKTRFNFITTQEALIEILKTIKDIKKGL
jgi:hypothetical protein